MFTELVQVSYADNFGSCLSIQACTKHDCSAWGLGKARAPRIMQVERDVRRFLVQSAAQGTICFEVLWGCSGLYPVRSSKPPRMELPQPCWVTSLSAWLFSQEKGSSLYPLWVSLISVYLDRRKTPTTKWNGRYLPKSLGEIFPARNSNSHSKEPVGSLPQASQQVQNEE